jgi:proteasome lid subunit RPN8/RPN11
MEENKEKKLELVHQQSIYKMVIPQEVEKKIRLLCREIHNVEWSGVLFYKVSGSFEDKSLTITCVDLFQMDEGTGGYTEYDMSPDVMGYMVDHPELLDAGVYQGLIHSHNNMATFFSGTDTATLQSEGSDMNHFVSLIVNNAGKYTAGVTRKAKLKQTVNEEFTYPTWGDERVSGNRVFTVEKEYIQWFNLDIKIEGVSNDFETEMLERIKAIRAAKSSERNIENVRSPYYGGGYKKEDYGKYPIGSYGSPKGHTVLAGPANTTPIKREVKQPTLFDGTGEEFMIDYEKFKLNDEIVDWVVKQTITCSVIIPNSSNIDVEKWARSMDSLYKKRFADKKEFEAFASNFVDFVVNYTEDPEAAAFLDATEMAAVLAYQVREKLNTLPKNEWLDAWMELYDDYIL